MTCHRPVTTLLAAAMLAGCNVSDDPAQGGFLAGVSGISQGTYDSRIAEREANVAAEQQRQAELSAELAGLQRDYGRAQRDLAQQRARATAAGKTIPPGLGAEIDSVLGTTPGGTTDAQRVDRYRRAVADARRLSAQLAGL